MRLKIENISIISLLSSLPLSSPSSLSLKIVIITLIFHATFIFDNNLITNGQTIENISTANLILSDYYTFKGLNSHIILSTNSKNITDKIINSKKELIFDFRTRYPFGILYHESYYNPINNENVFELLLFLQNGQLKVMIAQNKNNHGSKSQPLSSTPSSSIVQELIIGNGFHYDNVFTVKLLLNFGLNFFNIRVNSSMNIDNGINNKYYKSLYFNSTILMQKNLNYKIIFGHNQYDIDNNDLEHTDTSLTDRSLLLTSSKYGIKKFIGCMGNFNIKISNEKLNNFDTLSSSQLKFINVTDGCIDQCDRNLCSRRSKCINYYNDKKCDCFGTQLEDEHCRNFNYTIVTFHGYSSIKYKLYSFIDKYNSMYNLISLHIKTKYNGLLFFARSELKKSFFIINIRNDFLNLIFDLGVTVNNNNNNDLKNYIFNKYPLTDNEWHNITINHVYKKIYVFIDENLIQTISLDSNDPYFNFDPDIYLAGLPSYINVSQLNLPFHIPNKKFVGCMKHVYFNHLNILYELKKHNDNLSSKLIKYYSKLPIEFGCQQITTIPMTFHSNSYLKLLFNHTKIISLNFHFKLSLLNIDKFLLAKGKFQPKDDTKIKLWSLMIRNSDVKLIIEDKKRQESYRRNEIKWILSNDDSININDWNHIVLIFRLNGRFEMFVNEYNVVGKYDHSIIDYFYDEIFFGSIDYDGDYDRQMMKFIGCVRDLSINDNNIDPRHLDDYAVVNGQITIDNCQLINQCNRLNACEHDGLCVPSFEMGTYYCDCSNTGYIGRTCHFSLYRKSCEEIHLMDNQQSGIYLIDIDRNGPIRPAHVYCDISNSPNKTINTIIEHNLQHQVIVREKGQEGNYYMDVHYRDFDHEMLRQFVKKSDNCRQYIRYECNNAPLSLSTYTILYALKPEYKLMRLDSNRTRGCYCNGKNNNIKNNNNRYYYQPEQCIDPDFDCNCDAINIPGWKHDDGHLTSKNEVGITKMYFLQFPNQTIDSEAHLHLGNLSCQNLNTQRYEITFKTKESYLEVSGWNGNEMAISFKTTANKAVIFYQSHLDTTSTYFKATIISENEISFEYSLYNRKFNITISSSRCLNCGQWQHVLIERAQTQMRVSINQNSKILYLNENDHFIDFDGILYVGGAPLRYLLGQKITLGFIGCLRGLVHDDKVINLHQYLDLIKSSHIETGCRPYCKPNLCQNQALCIELWGSYQCRCANPIAHSGLNCEININTNAITLKSSSSYIYKDYDLNDIQNILKNDIILSFRTHEKHALLLFIHDSYKNFVQLHISNGTNVVLCYNYYYQKIIVRKINIGKILTNGHTVQIKISRQQNHTIFTVNKNSIIIPYSTKLIKNIYYSKYLLELINDRFIDNEAIISLNNQQKSLNRIYIGGIDQQQILNYNDSIIPGFIGCLQGFMFNNKLLNLEQLANEFIQQNNTNTNINIGCKMLCDDLPCNNGGICTEDWQNNSTICDCNYTSYRGKSCDIDIGAHFEKESSVLYYLDDKIMDFNSIDISFAFASSYVEGGTLFMLRYANSTRFLHIALLPNGKMYVEEDDGHEIYSKIIESEEDNFSDSYRHWIHYQRENDKSAQIIVDSIIFDLDEHYKEYEKSNLSISNSDENIIVIGSNRINNQNFSSWPSFRGCISNINIKLDDIKIDPFESAFGISSGLSDVKVIGPIKQSICSSFKIQQKTDEPLMRIDQTQMIVNRMEIWLNRPKPILVPFKMKNDENSESNYISKSNIVIIISTVYLSIILICVSIYLWKIDKKYRLLKFQGETPFFHKSSIKIEKNYLM